MSVQTIKKALVILMVLGLGVYGYMQMRPYLSGPQITITQVTPLPDHADSITLRGSAEHITHLTLNGNDLFTDSEGLFEETLLLLPGYNILTIEGVDRFGRIAAVRQQLYVK